MTQTTNPAAIANAVQELAKAPITNTRILNVFAHLLPAGYAFSIQNNPVRSWVITGRPGSGAYKAFPVQPGRGLEIITDLINQAWIHAQATGPDGQTRAEQAKAVQAEMASWPTCPECGKKVFPAEAAVSAVPSHHRDCC